MPRHAYRLANAIPEACLPAVRPLPLADRQRMVELAERLDHATREPYAAGGCLGGLAGIRVFRAVLVDLYPSHRLRPTHRDIRAASGKSAGVVAKALALFREVGLLPCQRTYRTEQVGRRVMRRVAANAYQPPPLRIFAATCEAVARLAREAREALAADIRDEIVIGGYDPAEAALPIVRESTFRTAILDSQERLLDPAKRRPAPETGDNWAGVPKPSGGRGSDESGLWARGGAMHPPQKFEQLAAWEGRDPPYSSGDRLWQAWPNIVGEALAYRVRPVCLSSSTLWLRIAMGSDSADLAVQLRRLSPEIRDRVNQAIRRPCVDRIIFLSDPDEWWREDLLARKRANPRIWTVPD